MGGPLFIDGIGYPIAGILGDYWQAIGTGTAQTATTVATGLPYTAGAATISVTANTNLTPGATFAVGALGTTNEEIRTVTSITGAGPYTVTPNAPMYQNHAAAQPVTPYIANAGVLTYTHNFSLLNSGAGMGGYGQAQPPTYTFTDTTGLGTFGARTYAYTAFSELALTGTSTALVMWDGKATSLASALALSAPAISTTTVPPQASWRSTLTLGGVQEFNSAEWKVTITRKLEPYFVNAGQQDPFTIARGVLTAAVNFQYDPAVDETEFTQYLLNTQPTLSIVSSNGLTGQAAASMTISIGQLGYTAANITDSKTVFGYTMTANCIANTVNAGPSGSVSPLAIALTNSVVNY
jgi:hypothetical protein